MLKDTIQSEVVKSMKAHDEVRLSTMRMLLSALNYERIDKMRDLTEDEELSVVKKEAKKRTDAIEMYEKANDATRADKEKAELVILKEFLPEELSAEQLSQFVEQSIAEVGSDFGAVMKSVMAKTQGRADGKVVSELVRAKLQ